MHHIGMSKPSWSEKLVGTETLVTNCTALASVAERLLQFLLELEETNPYHEYDMRYQNAESGLSSIVAPKLQWKHG